MTDFGSILDLVLVFLGVRTIMSSQIKLSDTLSLRGWSARGVGILLLVAAGLNYLPEPLKVAGKFGSMVLLLGLFLFLVVLAFKSRGKAAPAATEALPAESEVLQVDAANPVGEKEQVPPPDPSK